MMRKGDWEGHTVTGEGVDVTNPPEDFTGIIEGRKPSIVYLVCFSNHDPWEVDSAWSTREAAQRRADALPGDWRVGEMLVDRQML